MRHRLPSPRRAFSRPGRWAGVTVPGKFRLRGGRKGVTRIRIGSPEHARKLFALPGKRVTSGRDGGFSRGRGESSVPEDSALRAPSFLGRLFPSRASDLGRVVPGLGPGGIFPREAGEAVRGSRGGIPRRTFFSCFASGRETFLFPEGKPLFFPTHTLRSPALSPFPGGGRFARKAAGRRGLSGRGLDGLARRFFAFVEEFLCAPCFYP